jgi:hypothetical protein
MTFNNGKAAQQAIYKLDSISKIGGITTKRMLISFHKLNDADIKRAHQKNITLVHGDKLRTLLQSLNSWIDNN